MATTAMDEETDDDDASHLEDVPDGCGCVEMWRRASERRDGGE